MPFADPDRQRAHAREWMRQRRSSDPAFRERDRQRERERYQRMKANRTMPEPDPVCIAIRDGYLSHQDRAANISGTVNEVVAWAARKIEIRDGASVVASSREVCRALLQAGLERHARAWASRIDCAADDRWWLIPASGRMHECDADGHPLRRPIQRGVSSP